MEPTRSTSISAGELSALDGDITLDDLEFGAGTHSVHLDDYATAARARGLLGYGLALGVAADTLLRDGPTGLGATLWVALAVGCLIAATWRSDRDIGSETRLWLATGCAFAAFMSWRVDEALQFFNLCAVAFALGMAAVVQSGSPIVTIRFARLRDVITAALRVARDTLVGAAPLLRSVSARSVTVTQMQDRRGPLLRATALTLPVVLLLGALLRSADPIFARYVRLDGVEWGAVSSHIVLITTFTWLCAGWLSRPTLANAEPNVGRTSASFRIGAIEITAVLGATILLFSGFVLAQLGWLFGGESFLRQQTGLTVAEYARRGFFQMFWIAVLSTLLLLGTRALLVDDRNAHRLHTRLGVPVLTLVIAVVLSAVARLALYVRFYGLTEDRLFALVGIVWISVSILWLGATTLRERGERFVGGAITAGLALLLLMNVADPAAVVARTNLARGSMQSARTQEIDLAYLARLDDGAIPLAVEATLRAPSVGTQRCAAAETLLERSSFMERDAQREHSWRTWSHGKQRGMQSVRKHRIELRRIVRECPTASSSGSR